MQATVHLTINSAGCSSCSGELPAKAVEYLNTECFCLSLEEGALKHAVQSGLDAPDIFALLEERCPSAFAARPVFISASQAGRMRQVVQAVEAVVALPAYRERVLGAAPAIARHTPGGARSVFFGYDFHVHGERVGLIEINTNAGGAMLNAVLARAQASCCEGVFGDSGTERAEKLEQDIVAMFASEWRLAGRVGAIGTIAIVDSDPAQQYLYPEFLLFQRLFERHGIRTVIADPAQLAWREGALWHGHTAIDLVYNRSTDFMLDEPASASLRAAYLANAIVLTPHPQAYALYADKRNLAILSDPEQLAALGVAPATRRILLDNIPRTEVVDPAQHERLWRDRRTLFFKPASSYGSRGAYRGDKLTKRVWQDILAADYIAQEIVAPGLRMVGTQAEPVELKFDLRLYCYAGEVEWTAARLYQGQTTNFRTSGGGFAPVYTLDIESAAPALRDSSTIGR